MKRYCFILTLVLGFLACGKDERGQYALNNIPPGAITSPQVQNIAGGAIISYTIPNDEDLLYVKAVYTLNNGTVMEQKASVYESSLKVTGMGRSREQTVQLIACDRSKNESAPVEVKIHPMDAPIYSIMESVKIRNDFGGILLNWENPDEAEVVLTVLTPNELNKLTAIENFYTKAKTGKGNLRGYPPVERVFGIVLRDRWGNHTDTLTGTYLPILEERLDKKKFAKWNPPGIPYQELGGWPISRMWDNLLGNPGFSWPLTATLPGSFTVDLGQTAKLSRFKVFQRATTEQLYTGGNVKKFQVWGSSHPNVNDDFATWVKLGDYHSYKPSGLPLGQYSAEDMAYAGVAGEDYNVGLDAPPVRYLRFVIEETWGGSRAMQIMELDFFGDIQ